MIEKPLADSAEHALALVELAKRVNRVLMVDHTLSTQVLCARCAN